jgi:antirestriction protein ArdC
MSKYTDELQKTATIITNQMLEHGSDWTKCWTTTGKGLPINATTKKPYNGFNVWRLLTAISQHGFTSNEFVTWNQACEHSGLKRSENGKWIPEQGKGIKRDQCKNYTTIMVFKRIIKENKKTGEDEMSQFWTTYNLYNLDQTEGLDHLVETIEVPDTATTIDNVQEFVDNCQAVIKFGGDRAFYSPGHDHIQMPNMDRFEDSYGYYSTMLHELVHWTMKENRSNRPNSSSQSEYAFEELVAETGSALLCVMLGIESEPRPDHAKYLNGWIKAIKDNPKVIQQAFSKSQKAIDYLYSLQDKEGLKIAA